MSKKWIFLTCVLSLGSIETSQAHPLDSPDIVYIDGAACNRACQSYMAWSRQTLAAAGHRTPAQLRQHPASTLAHRTTAEGKQVRIARQVVPLPLSRAAMLQPTNSAAGKPNGSATTAPAQQAATTPTAPSAEPKPNNDSVVVAGRPENVPPADGGKAASTPPVSVDNPTTLPAVAPATRTLRGAGDRPCRNSCTGSQS